MTQLKANINLVTWDYVTKNVESPKFVSLQEMDDPSNSFSDEVFGVDNAAPETIFSYNPISVRFGYPIASPIIVDFNGPLTVRDFISKIAETYKTMYQEEEASNGKYGVWGHRLSDLYLEGAELGSDGVWHLTIGS